MPPRRMRMAISRWTTSPFGKMPIARGQPTVCTAKRAPTASVSRAETACATASARWALTLTSIPASATSSITQRAATTVTVRANIIRTALPACSTFTRPRPARRTAVSAYSPNWQMTPRAMRSMRCSTPSRNTRRISSRIPLPRRKRSPLRMPIRTAARMKRGLAPPPKRSPLRKSRAISLDRLYPPVSKAARGAHIGRPSRLLMRIYSLYLFRCR